MAKAIGDGPHKSKCTKLKGFIAWDSESTKSKQWLLANWQAEQKCSEFEILKL